MIFDFLFGSSNSCKPSPKKFAPSIVSTKARPGKNGNHHEIAMYVRPSANILPHDGYGGWTPTPMKLNPASAKMILDICSVVIIKICGKMLGNKWKNMIRKSLEPKDLAASMYSSFFIAIVTPLTT